VADPSGARIPQAVVHVQAHGGGASQDTRSDAAGNFQLRLAAGQYDVSIVYPGFRSYDGSVKVVAGATARVNAVLAIDAQAEEVTVPVAEAGSTASADNASAMVFKADDLKSFSDDDATFQREIEALAGGGGPKPPQILIDGFTGGKFPPKSSIREIRINSNPYSAEFDNLGFGRFEIFTKPGTDKLHGALAVIGTDNAFNGQNPYIVGAEPPYYQLNIDGNLNGPLDKKTSFFLAGTVNDQQNNAALNAQIIDPVTLQQVPYSQALRDPLLTNTYSLRIDRQVTPLNTLTTKYEFVQATQTNGGLTAPLTLPTQAFDSGTNTQTLQLSDTQVIGQHAVAETRFQYIRTRLTQGPASSAPTLLVQGGFNGGGNASQQNRDDQDRYELQEYVDKQVGAHFLRFGGRYRLLRDSNESRQNYNGQYTFNTLAAYQLTLQNTANCNANPGAANCLTPAQLTAEGAGPSQYSVTTGQASATVLTGDLGLYFDDEWKVRKNVTLDLGMRFETESGIPDHVDPAPRLGVAWAIYRKKQPKIPLFTLRGGGGLFYDRFSASNILTAVRQNGVSQQTFFLTNPAYNPNGAPPGGAFSSTPPTIYRISPNLRSEYGIAAGATIEKNTKYGHFSANYIFVRGDHQWGSRNINAPLPGTYNPSNPASGVRPLGGSQNIYQFESEGISKAQVGFINSRVQVTKRVVAFLSYTVQHQDQDVSNAASFASNSYNYRQDFGRTAQPSQQLYTGGTVQLPLGIAWNVFASTQGGTPFNITTGTDLNGDTIYNDRPAFATAPTPQSVLYSTRFGLLDANPQPGEKIIPINYGNSPNFLFLDLSLGRDFKVGPRPAAVPVAPGGKPAPKPDRPYTLSFNVDAGNVLNHRNPGLPVGVLSSPYFGQSLTLNSVFSPNTAANRAVFLQTTFSF
jgi:hypothetical protein